MKFHIPSRLHTETHYIFLNTSRCQGCWTCLLVCPRHVFGKMDFPFHRHATIVQAENCRGCLRCLNACPNQAILTKEKIHDNTSR